ncbi:MAG: hypothetical protein AAF799_07500 [Myxococcota bacterium]
MRARILAVALAGTTSLTGCVSAATPAPRLIPTDLQVGAMAHRTQFELDDGPATVEVGTSSSNDGDRSDDPESDKKRRRRKILFFLGAGAAGFGVVGTTGFGIGGRVVQAQIANGYEDQSLTRDRADTLTTTGEVMNGMAIGSAVIGLAGVILASTMYGIDHARCGDLPPRRKDCPGRDDEAGSAE